MLEKKVLFVATVVKKHINQFHLPYMKWFKEHGYEVHVCARNDFELSEKIDTPYCDKYFNIPFSRSPFSSANFSTEKELKKIIDENQYAIISCHTPVASVVTRIAARKARKRGTKVIYTAHGFHFYKGAPSSSKLYKFAERAMIPFTDAIVTINQEDFEMASKFCRHFSCESFLIHGVGVDIYDIQNTTVNRNALRTHFGIPSDAFVVMTTAELNRNKNYTTALKAFARVQKDNLYYLICGSGDTEQQYKQLAAQLGISNRVIFAGYRFDAKKLLHIADMFLFCSMREGLGLAAIEAMAAGLPLVASDVRGTREYAQNGVNSLLFQPDDVEGFAKGIAILAYNDEICQRFGENAANSVYKFDIKNSVRTMADIYAHYAEFDDIQLSLHTRPEINENTEVEACAKPV